MGKSGGLHWVTAGAPDAAEADVAARPPNASSEMDPTAATTTASSVLRQRRSSRVAGDSWRASPLAAIGLLMKTRRLWNSPAIRPWPKLRTIPPLHGPPTAVLSSRTAEGSPCNRGNGMLKLNYMQSVSVLIVHSL